MAEEPWMTQTQNTLGAVIKAPKLTPKLLAKPPFRFIHDCVTNFMSTTGMLGGLYEGDELDGKKVTEKDAKIQFLQKLLTTLNVALGMEVDCRPTKVISGSEPENTNYMLQALGQLASVPKEKVAAAVDQALGRAPPPQQQQAPPPQQEAPKPKPEPKPKPQEQPPAQQDPPPQSNAGRGGQPNNSETSKPTGVPSLPQNNQAINNEGGGGAQRPSSARRPPPAVPSNETQQERVDVKEIAAAGVIVEKKEAPEEKEEEDWMKLVEKQNEAENHRQTQQAQNDGDDAGMLARQALQAKKDQEEAARKAKQEAAAAGQHNEGIVLQARKKKDGETTGSMGSSELAKLREQLQTLTKAANPLGKLLEAIHDDVDTMSRDLETWRTEARSQSAAAQEAQRHTFESLREINAEQQVLDEKIKEQLSKINIVRAQIQTNDRTIEKLVKMVVNPDAKK